MDSNKWERGRERERDGPFSGSLSLLHCHYCRFSGEGKHSGWSWLNHQHLQPSSDLLRTRQRVLSPTD